MPKNKLITKYLTFSHAKIIFILFLWFMLIFSNKIYIRVSYVTFNTDISVIPRYLGNISYSSYTFQLFVYLFTFASLFEFFVLILILDKSILSFLPSTHRMSDFRSIFYSNIHKTCFSVYKFNIRLLFYSVYTYLLFPNATLWYYQMVLRMTNNVPENPGPIYTDQRMESLYFSFCNWNLNTLSKADFSRLSLLSTQCP